MLNIPGTLGYLAGAMGYAVVATLVVLAPARALRRFSVERAAPTLLVTLFFVFLTLHPFPDPAALDCPIPSTKPQLRPFLFWTVIQDARRAAGDGLGWLLNQHVASSAMNLALCGAIGWALSRHALGLGAAVLLGLGLSLLVELTQLTGIWGLYPCAYRQFDVDDLLLNTGGVAGGFALARGLRRLIR
jgi:hypothetical protein